MVLRKQHSRKSHCKQPKRFGGIIALWMSACAAACASQSVSLGWQSNGYGAAGYYVHSGSASGNYSTRMDVGTNNTATISSLIEGQTNYFTVTAYNEAGVEGSPAAEIAFIVPGVIRLLQKPTATDPVSLSMPVAPGHWYEIQASTDLKSWSTIYQTQTATSNAWTQVTDPQSGLFSSRYYRLVMH